MKRRETPPARQADDEPTGGPGGGDVLVAIAMGIVVFAAATALNLQLGLDINVAIALGAVAYAGLLALHALRRRASRPQVRRSAAPDFENFDAVHDRLVGRTPPPLPGGRSDRPLSQLELPASMRPRAKVAQVSLPSLSEHGIATRTGAPALPGAVRPGSARPYQPAAIDAIGAVLSPQLPQHPSQQVSGQHGAGLQGSGLQGSGAGDLESDVERIQALVKKLANEINAAEEDNEPQIYGRMPRLPADAAVDASVSALRQAAHGMSGPPFATPARPPQIPASAPQRAVQQPLSPAQAHNAAVADALVAGRVEVELEPILSLVDQRTNHYEVSVNVHGPAGERLVENGSAAGLQGTGLLPLLDSARLNRSVSIAQRLQERGKTGRVVSVYSVESLTNPSFMSEARGVLGDRGSIASQLVMGFQQADIRAFTPSEWAAVAELRHMHVMLAIEGMTHLDLDLKQLVTGGFAFIRVEAAQFLGGLRFGGRPVVGAELVRYVTGAGMTLIVDRIDTEQQLQRLGQNGVQMGQGRVFGGRRPVKLAATKAGHAAA